MASSCASTSVGYESLSRFSSQSFPMWAVELTSMVNKGLELCGSPRRLQPPSREYHEIVADLLDVGIAAIGPNCDCAKAAAAIAAKHRSEEKNWGTLANDAWMAAHHAGPFDTRQWVARAAARSAHGSREGRPDDVAITATWVARVQNNRQNAWHRIADVVSGSASDWPHSSDYAFREVPAGIAETSTQPEAPPDLGRRWHQGLAMVMRRYGFFALDVDCGKGSVVSKLKVINTCFEEVSSRGAFCTAVFIGDPSDASIFGLEGRRECCGALLKEPKRVWPGKRRPLYRPLLDFVSFAGAGLTPLLQTDQGRTVIGWVADRSRKLLVVGLDVVEELVRYTQGDPDKTDYEGCKNLWGATHEQAAFLYEGNVMRGHESQPWADKLGMLLAETMAAGADLPLISPLPSGLRGCVVLTGDDDQAWLEKYDEQLGIVGNFPITYFLLPHTNHTPETLARMPKSVEFGVHVDALDLPQHYEERCKQQTAEVRQLVGGRPVHAIRNHGHLNDGYWGHLSAWESNRLYLDFNVRGLDGTCPTGSYLPFRVRRQDGNWSNHYSIFSTFSDSMFFCQKWSQRRQIRTINRLARQIESNIPGFIIVNFHPQNVAHVPRVHHAVIAIGRRKGWGALGAESLCRWLQVVDGIRMKEHEGDIFLYSDLQVQDTTVRWPRTSDNYQLPNWQGWLKLTRHGAVNITQGF